mmetsp:Transcript_39244/g.92701  ORF Transcript_39244/g.92701 Transcript_39244/m.92701 type:complete len:545 (+) Transcript_39244:299-1933(+)
MGGGALHPVAREARRKLHRRTAVTDATLGGAGASTLGFTATLSLNLQEIDGNVTKAIRAGARRVLACYFWKDDSHWSAHGCTMLAVDVDAGNANCSCATSGWVVVGYLGLFQGEKLEVHHSLGGEFYFLGSPVVYLAVAECILFFAIIIFQLHLWFRANEDSRRHQHDFESWIGQSVSRLRARCGWFYILSGEDTQPATTGDMITFDTEDDQEGVLERCITLVIARDPATLGSFHTAKADSLKTAACLEVGRLIPTNHNRVEPGDMIELGGGKLGLVVFFCEHRNSLLKAIKVASSRPTKELPRIFLDKFKAGAHKIDAKAFPILNDTRQAHLGIMNAPEEDTRPLETLPRRRHLPSVAQESSFASREPASSSPYPAVTRSMDGDPPQVAGRVSLARFALPAKPTPLEEAARDLWRDSMHEQQAIQIASNPLPRIHMGSPWHGRDSSAAGPPVPGNPDVARASGLLPTLPQASREIIWDHADAAYAGGPAGAAGGGDSSMLESRQRALQEAPESDIVRLRSFLDLEDKLMSTYQDAMSGYMDDL